MQMHSYSHTIALKMALEITAELSAVIVKVYIPFSFEEEPL